MKDDVEDIENSQIINHIMDNVQIPHKYITLFGRPCFKQAIKCLINGQNNITLKQLTQRLFKYRENDDDNKESVKQQTLKYSRNKPVINDNHENPQIQKILKLIKKSLKSKFNNTKIANAVVQSFKYIIDDKEVMLYHPYSMFIFVSYHYRSVSK